jgi:hypothetical protein
MGRTSCFSLIYYLIYYTHTHTHANALAGGSEEGCVKAVSRTRERRALLQVKLARILPRRCVCFDKLLLIYYLGYWFTTHTHL